MLPTLIEIALKATFGESVELLVTGNECSVFLLFSRLKMDHLSFVFSFLSVVSVTTFTFESAIKANNPNGEVNEELTYIPLFKPFVCIIKWCLSLEIFMEFAVLFTT